jgi:hypothetical protein
MDDYEIGNSLLSFLACSSKQAKIDKKRAFKKAVVRKERNRNVQGAI